MPVISRDCWNGKSRGGSEGQVNAAKGALTALVWAGAMEVERKISAARIRGRT
jgi:hypothetical protein